MTSAQYFHSRPAVMLERWADLRETHLAVAMAIHALADDSRSAQDIWAEPTPAESDHVAMAVQNYVLAGLFDFEADGYAWGLETVPASKESR